MDSASAWRYDSSGNDEHRPAASAAPTATAAATSQRPGTSPAGAAASSSESSTSPVPDATAGAAPSTAAPVTVAPSGNSSFSFRPAPGLLAGDALAATATFIGQGPTATAASNLRPAHMTPTAAGAAGAADAAGAAGAAAFVSIPGAATASTASTAHAIPINPYNSSAYLQSYKTGSIARIVQALAAGPQLPSSYRAASQQPPPLTFARPRARRHSTPNTQPLTGQPQGLFTNPQEQLQAAQISISAPGGPFKTAGAVWWVGGHPWFPPSPTTAPGEGRSLLAQLRNLSVAGGEPAIGGFYQKP